MKFRKPVFDNFSKEGKRIDVSKNIEISKNINKINSHLREIKQEKNNIYAKKLKLNISEDLT